MSLLKNPRILFNLRSPVIKSSKYSTNVTGNQDDKSPGGYAKAFEKFENILEHKKSEPEKQTFSALLRNSKFIDLGDPEGKIVQGKIFHVVDDDLYIDFGWKFHCVCPKPSKNAEKFVRGAKVRLLIKELELSSRFLGYEKDLTLLEADCLLLGLVEDRRTQGEQTKK